MVLSLVLLLVCLAEASLHQLVPSNDPASFSGSGGKSAVSIVIGTEYPGESFPVSEWSASVWAYATTDGGSVIATGSPFVSLSWYGTTFGYYDGASLSATLKESFKNRWVFAQIGSSVISSLTYGTTTARGGNQYYLYSTSQKSLTSTSTFKLFQTCGQVTAYYMDLVLNLNRGSVVEADIRSSVYPTFLCSSIDGSSCRTCHPSCTTCTDGVCDACASAQGNKIADGAFCMCGVSPNLVDCPLCHASCGTCTQNGDPEKCSTCSIAEATLSTPTGGSCACIEGYVYVNYATSACVPCIPGCPYCVDTTQEACMEFKDLTIFASNLASSYQLPLLHETSGLMCYRQSVPTTTCDPLPTAVTGTINSDESGLMPTLDQCYELLQVQWPFVKYWFGVIFPHFTPPISATSTEEYELYTAVWLWILHFGPSTLQNDTAWQELVILFNSALLNWEQVLGWDTGYLAGGSTHTYPTGLTPNTAEFKFFNHFSKVCDDTGCGYKTQCQQVAALSTCATSP